MRLRGTQFRQWATEHLTEYIVKGIYDTFNAKRKQLDAQQADAEDIKMLEDLEKSIIEKKNI